MIYRVEGSQLTDIANAIRAKTGDAEPLAFPEDFLEGISGLVDTSDANATAEKIRDGYTAYVNGEKIVGSYVPQAEIRYNSYRNIPFDVSAGTHVSGTTLFTYERPSNEYWGGSMNFGVSGLSSGDWSTTMQNGVVTVKAAKKFTLSSKTTCRLTYYCPYRAVIV